MAVSGMDTKDVQEPPDHKRIKNFGKRRSKETLGVTPDYYADCVKTDGESLLFGNVRQGTPIDSKGDYLTLLRGEHVGTR